jgi:hypothetical protein
MATVALFVALGGSSYAAVRLARNSVGSLQIKNRQVKRVDIARGAVDSSRVADGSLLGRDFKAGELPRGPAGPPGAQGAQGPKGDTGSVDTSRFYSKTESDARFLAAGGKAADADLLDGLDATALARAGGHDEAAGFFSWTGAQNCSNLSGALTGPSVTVDVGPSGLVAVWAEAEITDFGTGEVRVQLFEPTDLAVCPTILRGNSATNGGPEVKRTLPGNDGGTTGFGGLLIVRVTPGTRTFTLRYGLTPDANFNGNVSNRSLSVHPL